jgi:CheY-like chemotaxis protein
MNLGNPIIVVAEDDEATCQMMAAALSTSLSAHVVLVRDGRRLLEAVRRLRPVAVVVDIVMPEMDGLAAIRALREEQGAGRLRVVAVSASSAGAEALAAGADAFLAKPFQVDGLVDLLASVAA